MSNGYLAALGQLFRRGPSPTSTAYAERLHDYEVWSGYYDNSIYRAIEQGGRRDLVNASLGKPATSDIGSFYNPIAETVDLYQHIFGGDFGRDITIESNNPKLTEAPESTGPMSLSPIDSIWRESNIDQKVVELVRMAATHGNAGIRIVMEHGDDPDISRRRVWLKPEYAGIIRDVEYDHRGNAEQVLLEYDDETGIDTGVEVKRIQELLTKEKITRWYVTHGKRDDRPFEDATNELGVVPYVILPHQPGPGKWGRNAFYRAIEPINRLNKLATHLSEQIDMHVRVVWMVSGSGPAPERFDFSGLSVLYVRTPAGASPSTADPMVANLDLAGALAHYQQGLQQVEDQLPELKAIGGRFLAGQSGETVTQLRKPAEDKLKQARPFYEDAVVRAQQIALSYGVLYGMWDIGTGTGSREAADRAYHQGYEAHTYNKRELLPRTAMERNTEEASFWQAAKAATDAGEPLAVFLEDQGWTEEKIQRLTERMPQSERINLQRSELALQRDQGVNPDIQARIAAALEGQTTNV